MIRKNDICHNAGSAPTSMEYLYREIVITVSNTILFA